ncbi:hypothetical protein PINS_up008592 [Pythium insidiosum]|nr:hypothetical protein PINS_up008592 [Pythium insidiosum]
MYNEGRGVATDPSRALALLREAADQRNPRALFHLGVMAEYGRGGVARNFALAAELYREASDFALPEALHYLAMLHASGRGVRKNTPQALVLLQRAAELGFAPAMLRLGEMYADGDGVTLDYAQGARLVHSRSSCGAGRRIRARGREATAAGAGPTAWRTQKSLCGRKSARSACAFACDRA